tara:strand:- start:133 stop:396 length:264 start_codon:yes stop_codon:yes gene_type:complete
MEINHIVSMTDIHEYAKQQLTHLEDRKFNTTRKFPKLTYREKEYNARIHGQIMAWQHVLAIRWINPNDSTVGQLAQYALNEENDNAE